MQVTTVYDAGRARIDELLRYNKPEEATTMACRMFPQKKTLIIRAVADRNEEWFRELCHIPHGCAWVDGEYVPSTFRGIPADSINAPYELIPSEPRAAAPVSVPASAPVPVPSTGEIVGAFRPLFVFVACVGGLVVLIVLIVVVVGSALSGLAAGLTTAFTVIGEYLAYIIAIALAVLGVLTFFSYSSSTDTRVTEEANQQEDGQQNINIFINSFNKK